ncbi:MAG TPA: acyl-CoA dehydrogenase family protein [Polyangiaceae bacterium]|nr:acyl-CoA dehydrogenase family protein [Polyangiaceae bacterium]
MEFSIPSEVQTLVRKVREFLATEVMPLEAVVARRGFRATLPDLGRLRKQVKELGMFAPHLPRDLGGLGLSLTDFAHVSEALGQSFLGHYVFNCQAPDAGNMELLLLHGTSEQKKRWLEPLARGDIRSCFAMTEPDRPGSNPTWLATAARHEGSEYVIDGHKWFTSGADGASFTIVMAVTNPDAAPHLRASQIIVPIPHAGFELIRNVPVMGHPGEDYESHGEVRFTACRVPESHRIGEEGAGFVLAQERLAAGRIHHCMRWMGICERAFQLMCERAVSRLIAPDKPLATRQTIQDWIAESRAEINAARLMVLQAAWKIDREGGYAAREEISVIKFYAAGVLQRVLDRAIQVHGALGITDDTPLAYWYRFERGARIYDGADEVHKSVVAKRILRGYGFSVKS